MRTKGAFHELADIVVKYAKEHKEPLNAAFFLAAMKAQAYVAGNKKTVNSSAISHRWSRTSMSTEPHSLEIAHTVCSGKGHVPLDQTEELFRLTIKGSWVELGETAWATFGAKVVEYSYSYSTREFAPPLISSIPLDLVPQVLALAAKTLGVALAPDVPMARARVTDGNIAMWHRLEGW